MADAKEALNIWRAFRSWAASSGDGCAPGSAHQRLTPSNCDELLFDDVLWVENAKRDHFDFIPKMRDRGIEVVEMHNLLTETLAIPEGRNGFSTIRSRRTR